MTVTRLGDLARAAGDVLVVVSGSSEVAVRGLAYDDAPVRPGDLFFCVRGRIDGHRFAGDAVAAGAVALCVEQPTGAGVPEIVVSDSRRAMARISAAFYDRPAEELTLLGVTGTNGKTTTTFLLEAILRAAGHRTGLIGTMGAWVDGELRAGVRASPATPPTLHRQLGEMRSLGVDSVVIEVTSHGLALQRLEGLRFRAAGFTNLSRDHLDFHGSLEDYFAAKRSLFVSQRADRGAVNLDDTCGRVLYEEGSVPLVGFGTSSDARVRAENVRHGESETRFTLVAGGPGIDGGRTEVSTGLVGAFNVSNCLAAAAMALLGGVALETVAAGLGGAHPVPGRFEAIGSQQPFAVVVDYAHTPAALDAVLREARRQAGIRGGRVICVFGCGGEADPGKRPLMGAVAAQLADRVVVTSDNPRGEDPQSIIEDILGGMVSGGGSVNVLVDRGRAIAEAVEQAQTGDVVLVAGKGHETGQRFREETVPFDDREVARTVLAGISARDARPTANQPRG